MVSRYDRQKAEKDLWQIQRQIAEIGLEEFIALAVQYDRFLSPDSAKQKTQSHPMSVILANYKEISELVRDKDLASYSLSVVQGNAVIGMINSDGYFFYENAPNLRTALGWAMISTEGGRQGDLTMNLGFEDACNTNDDTTLVEKYTRTFDDYTRTLVEKLTHDPKEFPQAVREVFQRGVDYNGDHIYDFIALLSKVGMRTISRNISPPPLKTE